MLIKSAVAIVLGMILSCIFAQQILALLQIPLREYVEAKGLDIQDYLIMLNVIDPLTITIKTGIFAGLILACPFLFYFIGDFVLPALHPSEKKMLIPAFTVGAVLFLLGVLFCYQFVVPIALSVFLEWGESFGMHAQIPLDFYVSFVLQLLVAFGVSFEMPLVIIILAKLGIVDKKMLTTYRRHAILFFIVFSACMTPADPFSMIMLFVPLYLLFEISVIATGFIETDRKRQEESFWED